MGKSRSSTRGESFRANHHGSNVPKDMLESIEGSWVVFFLELVFYQKGILTIVLIDIAYLAVWLNLLLDTPLSAIIVYASKWRCGVCGLPSSVCLGIYWAYSGMIISLALMILTERINIFVAVFCFRYQQFPWSSHERIIEFLESFATKISNRRSSKWLNDHLLMELVPPLNAEEIRGLFAPPPWGESTPLSPFCLINVGEWDRFRNIDMDEEASAIAGLDIPLVQRKDHFVSCKMDTLRAWQRVDRRSRLALRQTFRLKLVEAYEELIHAFVKESASRVFELQVQDPFHRLLLHGVCEFYNVIGVTVTRSEDTDYPKMISKIMQIKKKSGCQHFPPIKLVQFLRMARGELNCESSPLARSL